MSPDSAIGAPPRTLLLVEDNVGDARLVEERLKRGWTRNLDVHHVTRLDQAAGHLAGHRADCVLLDLSLPDSEGADGVRRLVDAFPDVPIVVLSGTNEEALVLECLHEGAQDYLVKDTVDGALIGRSVRYAVERKRAEHQLQGTDVAQRRVYRVATAGVGMVLLLLAAFSIGVATVTKASADRLEQASSVSAAYGEAVQATGEQDRVLAAVALGGGPAKTLRADHRRAAESVTNGLDGVRLSGDTRDRERADRAQTAHAKYLTDAADTFGAAEAGSSPSALAARVEGASAGFRATEQELAAAARDERSATLRRVGTLARTDDAIFVATLVAFSVGLGLLGLFGGAMRAYRGRYEQARRAELARRARSAAPAGV